MSEEDPYVYKRKISSFNFSLECFEKIEEKIVAVLTEPVQQEFFWMVLSH